MKRLFMTAVATIVVAQVGVRLLGHVTPHGGTVTHAVNLSPSRERHILYGDSHGGGHLHGQARPCKSEFPADWDAGKIIAVVTKEAANDNLDWRHERNGNDVAEVMEDGIKIRIVVNGRHDQIITAYPLNTPRNLCPAAANDNTD